MFRIIFNGVTLIPPSEFVLEVLRLLGIEDPKDLTLQLLYRLGFKRGQ